MKESIKIFFRTFFLGLIISGCLTFGIYGIFSAWEATRLIGFGEYVSAVEITEEGLRIMDFIIQF